VTDLEQKVALAKRDIATAQDARAKAEHAYRVARAQAEAAAKDLKDEFGVSSAEVARQVMAKLEADLEAECTTVREALARTGQGADQ
jgi:adenylyl- and sulfurtransferase ThiI